MRKEGAATCERASENHGFKDDVITPPQKNRAHLYPYSNKHGCSNAIDTLSSQYQYHVLVSAPTTLSICILT